MMLRQRLRPGPVHARSSLQLQTRLTLAQSGKLERLWAAPKHNSTRKDHTRRHRVCCKKSDRKGVTLRKIGVELTVREGDSLESLSAKYGISESKLRKANGGGAEISPGQTLEMTIKVPDNLMPTADFKLVPVEAAYSDDEQEVALARENRKIRQMESQEAVEAKSTTKELIGTAGYVAGTAVKVGIVLLGASIIWSIWRFVRDYDQVKGKYFKSRLDNPAIRAEMVKRHGQSFLEHLDSENAEAEAEEIFEAQEAARKAAAKRARQQQSKTPAVAWAPQQAPVATAAESAMSSPAQSQHQQQRQPEEIVHEQEEHHQQPVHALHEQQQQQHKEQQQHEQQHQRSLPAVHQQSEQQQQQQQQQPLQTQQKLLEPIQAQNKPHQELELAHALHNHNGQHNGRQEPLHATASAPSASHASAHKPVASPPADPISNHSPTPDRHSHIQHMPSSTTVSTADGLSSAASGPEVEQAAGQNGHSPSLSSSLSHDSPALPHAASGLRPSHSLSSDNQSATQHAPSSASVSTANKPSVAGLETETAAAPAQDSHPPSLSRDVSHDSTALPQVSGDESSVPESARSTSSSMADSPSDVPATSVNPDPAQAADEASAVPTNPPAVDAIDTPADDPGPVADPADVDHVLQEYPWLASELLYFATDDEGRALIDRQEADEEAGTEEQQRFLAFESDEDLRAMLYKTAAVMPVDMVGAADGPLMLLTECLQGDMQLAVVREGGAMGLEQVSDAAEWLQQLGDSAQILSPDAMRDIMLEWLDKQEALEKIGSDAAEATAEAGMDAEAEAGTETDAEADTEGAAAADVQAKGASHAPQMSHASSPEPHGSGVPAAASTSRQPKGGKPLGERESAYAAMKRKESVQLSKDSLNQLNMESIQAQDAKTAPQPQAVANPRVAKRPSQNGSNSSGGPRNTNGTGDHWQQQSHILVPIVTFRDGTTGCVIADMAKGTESENHVLGFLARSDAEEARYLMQANLDKKEARVEIEPMEPEQLQMRASELQCDVTVYHSGQLQLKPGMTLEQILKAAVAAR